MKKLKILVLLLVLVCLSCKKEEVSLPIDPELQPYVDNFVEEGAKRGIILDVSRLEAKIVDRFSEGDIEACGLAYDPFNTYTTPRFETDRDCWDYMEDDFFGEYLKERHVFHELGHAILRRGHRDDLFENNFSTASIMSSVRWAYYSSDNILRDYYIDELFNINTPLPEELFNKEFSSTLFQDYFENSTFNWQAIQRKVPDEELNNLENYELSIATDQNAMVISNKESVTDDSGIMVFKNINITDFQNCSNIRVKANIRTEGMINSQAKFFLSIGLNVVNPEGELERFSYSWKEQSVIPNLNSTFNDFEYEIYCIPEETDVVTIGFNVYFGQPAKFYVDDITVDILE